MSFHEESLSGIFEILNIKPVRFLISTMKQIFLKALRHLLDPFDRSIERIPFDIVYGEKDGTVVHARAVCTSSNFKNDTFNFKYTESGEVRTVHAQLLFRVNGMEVMI